MSAPQPPASSLRPFATAPDPNRYFPASAVEEARRRVGRSVQRGEGPVLVIGAAGLGKTMLLEVIAQLFRQQLQSVTLMGGQLCTRRALLQMILFQLDLPYREMDESEMRLSLMSYLQPRGADVRRILLLVDEADALPPRLLEELRALTNLSEGGQLLVNLVLAGNSTLEEQFADPKLELFSQRVSARCYLSAFGREETFQYVRAQVSAVGNDPGTLFTDDGLEAIFTATDGVPRLINQLGDQLLWTVSETGYSPLDGQTVQQAWSELQQLPAPWNTPPEVLASGPASGVVEFGELSTDEDEIEEFAFEDDSYSVEYDDDLPASIPINAPQPIVQPSVDETPSGEQFGTEPTIETPTIETIDVTEQLLEQLQVVDSAQIQVDYSDPAEIATRNPFSETFESEEVVLDRYSVFESLLLAEAPRVVNRTDTAFAQQLKHLEVAETQPTDLASIVTTSAEDLSPSAPSSIALEAEAGDILIIEECEQSQTTIVNGEKFRQLFSSLESAGGESCFG